MEIGDTVACINTKPLNGNDVAPPLNKETVYMIENIILDKKGNKHLDVGLKSKYNFVRSIETGEELPNGNKIHWCHPSRFTII